MSGTATFEVAEHHCEEDAMMVLAVLIAFGTVTGAAEGLKASQQKARREEHRSRKNNLVTHVPKSSEHCQILEGRRIVLSGDKVSLHFSFRPDIGPRY